MPVVLVFGDSNAWGFWPGEGGRMAPDVRWPGVMARALGKGFAVIEEGLCGRTTVFEDVEEEGRNGLVYFGPCVRSHAPLDLVVIALGCNDVKAQFAATPETIAAGAERLVDLALASTTGPAGAPPTVILVAPPPLSTLTEYAEMFEGGAEKTLRLPSLYRALAEDRGIGFVDAGEFIACSPADGIHYAPDQHGALGVVLAEAVRMMLE